MIKVIMTYDICHKFLRWENIQNGISLAYKDMPSQLNHKLK